MRVFKFLFDVRPEEIVQNRVSPLAKPCFEVAGRRPARYEGETSFLREELLRCVQRKKVFISSIRFLSAVHPGTRPL